MKLLAGLLILGLLLNACTNNNNNQPVSNTGPSTPLINFSVVKTFPHDTTLFTEGFLVHDGQFFESTGSPEQLTQTRSMIGVIDTMTGKLNKKVALDPHKYFGEGIVFLKNKLYQLTYRNHICFVYDAITFKQIDQFKFENNEGWSLTSNGTDIIMSDGTDKLTYIDPNTFKPLKELEVTQNGFPRDSLNELEYIKGYLYANIWLNSHIVKIDPSNGKVVGELDMTSVIFDARQKNPNADALNGIAYDPVTDKIYVTGKLWPNIYEINFSH
jgi:glutamine cyclotransferase